MIQFFKKEEEQQIIAAIQKAEKRTSGEVRVHLEKNARGDILSAAAAAFQQLGMHETQARNGVLIFLAPDRREFAIIGDQGIHQAVGEDFWQAERDLMEQHFRKGAFCEGICTVVAQIGEKLKANFPYQSDDKNELPDEISYS